MKNTIAALTGIACLIGLTSFSGLAWGQGAKDKAAVAADSGPEIPHKIGLVDLGYVFKEYKKFEMLREDLKIEVQESETKAKTMAEGIQAIAAQLKAGDLKEGSPEFIALESKFTQKSTEFETFRKVTQNDLRRKESKLYQTIYLEVSDAVEKFSKHYNYTMIMRFSRDDLAATNDPQKMVQGLNRQVVYFRPEDDISESVVEFLNRKYSASVPAKPASPGTQGTTKPRAGGTATKPSATSKN